MTGLPAGLAASGRAAADSSSLKVDFSGCFCLSFSVALFTGAFALAGSSVPSRVCGVAATVGVPGAVVVGEATALGVSPPFSFARRSALRFFHSASLAARAACLSSGFSASFLSSRETEVSLSPRRLSGAGVTVEEPGRRDVERRRLSSRSLSPRFLLRLLSSRLYRSSRRSRDLSLRPAGERERRRSLRSSRRSRPPLSRSRSLSRGRSSRLLLPE